MNVQDALQIVVSFDVEEHHRIESASGLDIAPEMKTYYGERLETSTGWLLDELNRLAVKATFFVLGDITLSHPDLVRAMHQGGHEVACHGWDHQRIHRFTPETFREDVRKSKDALEQTIGAPVVGYRAPTFSLMRQTAWAVDVLAEAGMLYDSSIYPVHHDRYGVVDAPRWPFRVRGATHTLLEMPLMTWRCLGMNVPVAGGGYFRLLPLWLMERAISQTRRNGSPAVAMLYFHPWEFDPEQKRLPLRRLNRFRTYVGMNSSRQRLSVLLKRHQFTRAIDVAHGLQSAGDRLPAFALASQQEHNPCV